MEINVGDKPLYVGGIFDSCPTCKRTWQYHANEPQGVLFAELWIKKQINAIKAHKALCYLSKAHIDMMDEPGGLR